MPFDTARTRIATRKEFHAASPRERLVMLRDALREESRFKENFTWDFETVYHKRSCGTVGCAMGLAQHLWGFSTECHTVGFIEEAEVCKTFGISKWTTDRLFWGTAYRYFCRSDDITAGDVADAIDEFLNRSRAHTRTSKPVKEITDAI